MEGCRIILSWVISLKGIGRFLVMPIFWLTVLRGQLDYFLVLIFGMSVRLVWIAFLFCLTLVSLALFFLKKNCKYYDRLTLLKFSHYFLIVTILMS